MGKKFLDNALDPIEMALWMQTGVGSRNRVSERGLYIPTARDTQHPLDHGRAQSSRARGNVTSAGWQVTLCDPIWRASSRSGAVTFRTTIHSLLTYLLTYNW